MTKKIPPHLALLVLAIASLFLSKPPLSVTTGGMLLLAYHFMSIRYWGKRPEVTSARRMEDYLGFVFGVAWAWASGSMLGYW